MNTEVINVTAWIKIQDPELQKLRKMLDNSLKASNSRSQQVKKMLICNFVL